MNPDDLDLIFTALRDGKDSVHLSTGIHGIDYYDDDEFGPAATIGFNLPHPLFAEIEDGTYGQLQGFRVFLADIEEVS